jgi:Barstar (barnase inhibitor)
MYTFERFLTSAPSGLYRLLTHGASMRMTKLCRLKDAELFCVNGEQVRTKRRFLVVIARAMGLPRWFGMNWDALADSLTDFAWEPGTTHVLLLSALDGFAQHAPLDFGTALGLLDDAASFWAEQDVRFLVLIEAQCLPRVTPLPVVSAP